MSRLLLLCLVFCCFSCSLDDGEGEIEIFTQNYDFSDGFQGWSAEFTDYPVPDDPEADSVYQWRSELTAAPSSGRSLMISSTNASGDLFMFIKRKIEGLRPNTSYSVVYEVALSTNAVAGQGVILKCGAAELEPKKVIEDNYYVFNLDKGEDTTSGENAIALGDIGALNGEADYNSVVKGNINAYEPFVTRTNSKGELWLFMGTDSLFEGTTTVYFTDIKFIFSVNE